MKTNPMLGRPGRIHQLPDSVQNGPDLSIVLLELPLQFLQPLNDLLMFMEKFLEPDESPHDPDVH